jgi:NADH:ubiquinone oxidoreductase subunit E
MGRFSTLAPSEYRAMLLPALEAIQAEMGWTPVRGLG